MLRANLSEQVRRAFGTHGGYRHSRSVRQRLHSLLRSLVLSRVDRIDACVAKHARNLLRSHLTGGTQIDVRIVRVDKFLGMSDQNYRGDWPPKCGEVAEDDYRTKDRE